MKLGVNYNIGLGGLLSEDHLNSFRLNHLILFDILKIKKSATVKEISSSGKFSETNIDLIKEKIDFLGLDNVKLVQGSFADTMNENSEVKSIMAAVVDCDLYQSYQESLNFIWPKLSRGGFVHLDEYYSLKFPGPRKAVLEFLNENRNNMLNNFF